MMSDTQLPLSYFGKLPARGDFVRARHNVADIENIDRWVSDAIRLSGTLTETLNTLSFSHIDTTAQQVITGSMLASHDSSGRKYPLIGFCVLYLEKPKQWMNYLPTKALPIWTDIDTALNQVVSSPSEHVTDLLSKHTVLIHSSSSPHYYDFINSTTLNDIAAYKDSDKQAIAQQIIATGLLFLPTYTKGFHGLNKTLCWTLGHDKDTAVGLATFWHDLIHGFYQPHELHLNTYFYKRQGIYQLFISFGQPDSHLLAQITDTDTVFHEDWVMIDDSQWTQEYIDEDIGLTRFSHMLLREDSFLYDVRQLFKTVFLAQ
ncbi:type VI secretion system-associated protein TagF [Psychrobacter aestuarii]|uniref:Type VI secretion system-associated protein TagF n=1 Tax=Psychrobacter aestuarii TaxID=556327 RepID=A0ABN0VRV9_9GAMM|nr:type VI secretion system-associated protein TagF [Psychrobacter aestuarii]